MSCKHERKIDVSGKTSDMNFVSYKNQEHDGYLPSNLNIGGGDYIEITFCADCGQLDGVWPLPQDIELSDD